MRAPTTIHVVLTPAQMEEWEAGYREAERLIAEGLVKEHIGVCSRMTVVWMDGYNRAWSIHEQAELDKKLGMGE